MKKLKIINYRWINFVIFSKDIHKSIYINYLNFPQNTDNHVIKKWKPGIVILRYYAFWRIYFVINKACYHLHLFC